MVVTALQKKSVVEVRARQYRAVEARRVRGPRFPSGVAPASSTTTEGQSLLLQQSRAAEKTAAPGRYCAY